MEARCLGRGQRHRLRETPLRTGGKEAANRRSPWDGRVCTALADPRAPHHAAFACLVEVSLDTEAGFPPFPGKHRLLSSPGTGLLAGTALAN